MVFTLDIKRNDSVDDNVVIIIHILIAIVNRISLTNLLLLQKIDPYPHSL
jgi:hypothetical protein